MHECELCLFTIFSLFHSILKLWRISDAAERAVDADTSFGTLLSLPRLQTFLLPKGQVLPANKEGILISYFMYSARQ